MEGNNKSLCFIDDNKKGWCNKLLLNRFNDSKEGGFDILQDYKILSNGNVFYFIKSSNGLPVETEHENGENFEREINKRYTSFLKDLKKSYK